MLDGIAGRDKNGLSRSDIIHVVTPVYKLFGGQVSTIDIDGTFRSLQLLWTNRFLTLVALREEACPIFYFVLDKNCSRWDS